MLRICRAEDGEIFQVRNTHNHECACYSSILTIGERDHKRHRTVRVALRAYVIPVSTQNPFIRVGSLESFLHQETGVEQEAILAYLSDGRRLRNDNIRELAGAQDQVCSTSYHFH
jgi:hypothetical protein